MSWGKWVKVTEGMMLYSRRRLLRYCIERLGITEADLRSTRYAATHDVMQVRLWNGRRLTVTGADIAGTKLARQMFR